MKDKNLTKNYYIQINKNENTLDKNKLYYYEKYPNRRNELDSKETYKENDDSFNSQIKIKEKEIEEIINNKQPKGLLNLSLNCYMNALLQCFFI